MNKCISFPAFTMTLAISLLALASTDAWTAPVEELTKQLRASLSEDMKSLEKKGGEGKGQGAMQNEMNTQMLMQLQMLQQAVQSDAFMSSDNEFGGARGWLQGLAAMTPSEKTRKLALELVAEVKKVQQEKENAWLHNTEETLKTCLQKGFAAKLAKEIDPLLVEVGKVERYSGDRYNRSTNVRALTEEVGAAKVFLRHWQTYLAATAFGNKQSAIEALRDMTSSNQQYLPSFIPRSELLARLNALQPPEKPRIPVATIVAQTKTLEDLPKAIDALRQNGRDNNSSNSDTALAYELRRLFEIYAEVKAGSASSINNVVRSYPRLVRGSDTDERIPALRGQLVRLALPIACGLEDPKDQPNRDENIGSYIRRVIDKARQRQDWPLLARIIEVSRDLGIGVTYPDVVAMHSFLGALNLEKVKSYPLAVSKFHSAINTGSQHVPVDFIATRLESIKKDHPQEYEAGLKIAEIAAQPYRQTVFPPSFFSSTNNDPSSLRISAKQMSNLMMQTMSPQAFSNWVQRMSERQQRLQRPPQ